jgi:hypothetical protein
MICVSVSALVSVRIVNASINASASDCLKAWELRNNFTPEPSVWERNPHPADSCISSAGLNVSLAARDYLGPSPTDATDCQFIEVRDIPPGPWRNYGDNNQFVIANRQSEQ